MDASRLVQALFGSAAIIGSGVLGFTLMTNTIVAQTNFNKQQCRMHDPSVQALAIDEPSAADCVCPPGSSARQLDDNQRPAGAASTRDCFIQTPQQITNFNQPRQGQGQDQGQGQGQGQDRGQDRGQGQDRITPRATTVGATEVMAPILGRMRAMQPRSHLNKITSGRPVLQMMADRGVAVRLRAKLDNSTNW